MEPEPRLDGNVHLTGPFINELVEPPEIADVAVLVTESKFAPEVVSLPAVRVSLGIVLAVPNVTPLELLMMTPPLPLKVAGNSVPVVCALVPLYCKVAAAPYAATVPAVVAVPSIERMPLTVAPVVVFAPLPDNVRLL